jgi:hypothetical protein
MIDTQWNNLTHACVLELKSRRNMVLFDRVVTITAAAAATAIPIITNDEIPANYRVFLWGATGKVDGATPWATSATITLRTKAASPTTLGIFYVAEMTANAFLNLFTGSDTQDSSGTINTQLGSVAQTGAFADDGYGIEIIGDANGTGSDFKVRVWGCVAPPQLTTAQWGQGTASGGGDQLIR